MAVLRGVRDRSPGVTPGGARRPRGLLLLPLFFAVALPLTGCLGERGVPAELQPDSLLRSELGLTDADEVHRVLVTSDAAEEASPDSVAVPPGAWVEFATGDWRVHEVRFLLDEMTSEAREFLASTDQVASPPLVDRDSRFVVSFAGAPSGRYPYAVEGNAAPARGVVVVVPRP